MRLGAQTASPESLSSLLQSIGVPWLQACIAYTIISKQQVAMTHSSFQAACSRRVAIPVVAFCKRAHDKLALPITLLGNSGVAA